MPEKVSRRICKKRVSHDGPQPTFRKVVFLGREGTGRREESPQASTGSLNCSYFFRSNDPNHTGPLT